MKPRRLHNATILSIKTGAAIGRGLSHAGTAVARFCGTMPRPAQTGPIVRTFQQSEARFRLLFEHSPDAIFVESLTGDVLDANAAACRLHGRSREELIGANVVDLVPADQREHVRRSLPD